MVQYHNHSLEKILNSFAPLILYFIVHLFCGQNQATKFAGEKHTDLLNWSHFNFMFITQYFWANLGHLSPSKMNTSYLLPVYPLHLPHCPHS